MSAHEYEYINTRMYISSYVSSHLLEKKQHRLEYVHPVGGPPLQQIDEVLRLRYAAFMSHFFETSQYLECMSVVCVCAIHA